MPLTLYSCERAGEFSSREAAQLALDLDRENIVLENAVEGKLLDRRRVHLIIEALRAFA